MIELLISRIIKRNGFRNDIYIRRHLKDLIKFQRDLRKAFNLPKGVWEYSKWCGRIDLWCIDRDQTPAYYRRKCG